MTLIVRMFFIFFVVGIVGLFPPSVFASSDDDERMIRATWKLYCAAVEVSDSEEAAKQMSKLTFDWYELQRDRALTWNPKAIEGLPPGQMFVVLRLQRIFSAEKLRSMSGRDLFKHAIDNQYIGQSFFGSEIGKISFIYLDNVPGAPSKKFHMAHGAVVMNGKAVADPIQFIETGLDWLIDLGPVFFEADKVLAQKAEKDGISNFELVTRLLKNV